MALKVMPLLSANNLNLRPYQEESLAAIGAGFAAGVRRPLLVLPTGTGKTEETNAF
jgi:superfamily II DNA or RNA helicase